MTGKNRLLKRSDNGKMKSEETESEKPEKAETLFTKEQLLRSERFQDRKDLLNALLSPEQQYTMKQAEQKTEDYKER